VTHSRFLYQLKLGFSAESGLLFDRQNGELSTGIDTARHVPVSAADVARPLERFPGQPVKPGQPPLKKLELAIRRRL
jgi:hypothetical protein